jgi:hypothetical protein
MENQKPDAEIGEFKGNKVITIFINNDPNYKFTFGLGKARAIVEYLDDIKKFIADNESK